MNHRQNEGKPASAFRVRDVIIVLLVAWAVRFLYACFMPPQALSDDMTSWETVARLLSNSHNPYRETAFLNWPPFWMQVIFLAYQLTGVVPLYFDQVLRLLLGAVESAAIVVLFNFLRQVAPQIRGPGLVLVGIALNPVAISLICQQGGFDVFVGLWMLLFIGQLVQYHRTGAAVDWLAACVFLGLGILTGTVPLALCPLLAGGLRRVSWKSKWTGAMLLFGPVALGLSVIFVLAPADVSLKVLHYRTVTGCFGISGLLQLAGAENFTRYANWIFYVGLLAAGGWVGFRVWRRERVEAPVLILGATLFLLAIPALGPGYSPQYLYWSLPLLIVSGAVCPGAWRRVAVVFGVIAALTSLVEYALFPAQGRWLYFVLTSHLDKLSPAQTEWLDWFTTPRGQVLARLPLFAAFLAALIVGGRILIQNLRNPAADPARPIPKS